MRHLTVWLIAFIAAANIFAADLTLADKLKLKVKVIKLQDASLAQAIETVRRHAKEADPDKKGINIILQQTGVSVKDKKINLNMTDIPLQDVINYIAESVGMTMSITERVVLISKTSKAKMATKFYTVSNSFKSFVNSKNPRVITQQDLKDFFAITGVSFPPNSAIAYIPGKNLLSVTNTVSNQGKVHKALVGLNCLR